ncbi:MAG: hypothetical protein E7232_09150 [Lachnospiraceae bacterium]|nr:hypothetical protein [Lachnospiraceae bacterium]
MKWAENGENRVYSSGLFGSYTGFTAPAKQTVNINTDGSRVVTYNYTRNKYTFTLGSNASQYSHGINTSGSTTTGSYYYGATITLKATPKAGYKWQEWSDHNANQNRTITMPANNLTITPTASLITYTIRYNTCEGNLQKQKVVTYNVESSSITLENPTRDGKVFIGWSDWNNPTPKKPYTIPKGTTGDLIISANWKPNTSGYGDYMFTGQSYMKSNRFKIAV